MKAQLGTAVKLCALLCAALYLCACSVFYTVPEQAASGSRDDQPLFVSAPSQEEQKPRNSFVSQVQKAAQKNPDTVGWLYIPGTDIDNSVLQSFDNSYYIRRNEQRKDDIYGCYFADADAPIGTVEEFAPNTIIYGHSDLKDNPDGKRFSQLFRFTDETFAKQTPNIYFSTAEKDLVWRVFAVFYTHVSFNYILTHPTETEFARIVEKAKEGSLYQYDVDVTADDRVLTLSTCSVKYGTTGEYRLVVMSRLVREGEDYADKLNTLKANPEPKLQT